MAVFGVGRAERLLVDGQGAFQVGARTGQVADLLAGGNQSSAAQLSAYAAQRRRGRALDVAQVRLQGKQN